MTKTTVTITGRATGECTMATPYLTLTEQTSVRSILRLAALSTVPRLTFLFLRVDSERESDRRRVSFNRLLTYMDVQCID